MILNKGKPAERQGRKAKGLRSEDYDSRLPHSDWLSNVIMTGSLEASVFVAAVY